MKRLLLCVLCLLLLASCGQKPQQIVAGEAGDEDAVAIDLSHEIVTAAQPAAEQTACEALRKDGAVYGFEMRFRFTDAIDALMAAEENFYFGVLQCGGKKTAVPTEDIRVLVDVPTGMFVLTLLVPQDTKLSGRKADVSFYICARADGASKALFAAQQAVDIS